MKKEDALKSALQGRNVIIGTRVKACVLKASPTLTETYHAHHMVSPLTCMLAHVIWCCIIHTGRAPSIPGADGPDRVL